jgi:hypothetical protein
MGVAARGLAALTANVDNARSRSVPWQDGHSGVSDPRTSTSKCVLQPRQSYSYRGMGRL